MYELEDIYYDHTSGYPLPNISSSFNWNHALSSNPTNPLRTCSSEQELSGFVNLIWPIRYSHQSEAAQGDLSPAAWFYGLISSGRAAVCLVQPKPNCWSANQLMAVSAAVKPLVRFHSFLQWWLDSSTPCSLFLSSHLKPSFYSSCNASIWSFRLLIMWGHVQLTRLLVLAAVHCAECFTELDIPPKFRVKCVHVKVKANEDFISWPLPKSSSIDGKRKMRLGLLYFLSQGENVS